MKKIVGLGIALITLASCSSSKDVANPETLPKDISLKPHDHFTQEGDQQNLKTLIKEIDSLIGRETCTDAADWKFTAIGAKACGGPSSYLAYPITMEDEILPKIQTFTSMQSDFNVKYNLMSDCAMVLPPVGIRCEDGKAILTGQKTEVDVPDDTEVTN